LQTAGTFVGVNSQGSLHHLLLDLVFLTFGATHSGL